MKPHSHYRRASYGVPAARTVPSFVVMMTLFAGPVWGQTTFSWRSEAGNGDWDNSSHWWNGSANSTAGFGVLFFNNNAHLSMNNNMPGGYSTHALHFGSPNDSPRTLAGNTLRLYDSGGADPYIRNESSATHLINLNLEGDGDAGDPLKIQLNGSGGFTFGGTLNNQGSWVDVVGSTTSAATATFNGAISGSGGFFKDNTNTTAILAVANSYSGGTTLAAGSLLLGNDAALGSGVLTLNGGTIASQDSTARVLSNALGTIGGNITFGQSSGGTGTLTFSHTGSVSLGSGTRTLTTLQNTTLAGSLTSGNLTKAGDAILTLTHASSSIGTLAISAGTLRVTNALSVTGFTTSSGTLDLQGGVLTTQLSSNGSFGATITGSGSILKTGSAQLSLNNNSSNFSGGIVIREGTINWNNNSALGTGTVTLNDASSGAANTGLFRNAGGTLANSIVVANHGSGITSIGSESGSGNTIYNGSVQLFRSATVTTGTSTGVVRMAGVISESGGLRVTAGAGTVELMSANTYSGGTTLTSGILRLGNNAALGSGGLTIDLAANNASKLLASNDSTARTLANPITFSGPASNDIHNRLTLGQSSGGTGSLTLSGGIELGANTSATQNARILQVIGNHTISGAITAAGSDVFLVKQSPGTLTLSGANTFAGNLIIDEGRIRLHGGSLAAGNLFLGGGLADTSAWNASLELASASTYSRSLIVQNHDNAGGARELVFSHGSGTATLSGTVSLEKTLDVSGSGHGHLSGLVSGSGGISKTGSGLLELSAANTYTGPTTVSAGTLAIQGNQTNATGALSLTGAGTTLMGTGTIGGATTLGSGTLHAPGNSIGIQSFAGDLHYASGSIFEWEIDRTTSQTRGIGYDAVNVAGALTGSDAIFRIVIGDSDFSNAFWDVSRSWSDIFTAANGITAKSNWTAIFSGGFQYFDTNGVPVSAPDALTRGSFGFADGNTLVWNAIPEPGSALVTLLLAAGMLRRQRDARCRVAQP